MRSSTETVTALNLSPAAFKDERDEDWSPQRLSDRKLVELKHRLDRLHSLGDAFAGVTLSETARTRLNGKH